MVALVTELEDLSLADLDALAAWAHAVAGTPGVTVVEPTQADDNAPHGPGDVPPTAPGARTTRDLRTLWAPACSFPMAKVALHGEGSVSVRASIVDAVRALDACLVAHGYRTRRADTGAYNCRQITGGTAYSLHAHGIALDLNWSTNPYGPTLVTDMPPAMVDDITSIRTRSGARVWRWGGTYTTNKDAMHYEVVASPQEIASGIDAPSPDPAPLDLDVALARVVALIDAKPLVVLGDRGPAVVDLWDHLEGSGIRERGMRSRAPVFGSATDRAVRRYQEICGLRVDGKVGRRTWGALVWDAIARL